jgi:hypothetical protein
MPAAVPILRQLARQVGGSVKCNSSSMVVGATRLVAKASGTALDDNVCFLGEFSITADAFAAGQVLNFGSWPTLPTTMVSFIDSMGLC